MGSGVERKGTERCVCEKEREISKQRAVTDVCAEAPVLSVATLTSATPAAWCPHLPQPRGQENRQTHTIEHH